MKHTIFAALLSLFIVSSASAGLNPATVAGVVVPSNTLVAPFDLTDNNVSFHQVTRLGKSTSGPVATHWAYWSEDCRHLVDVFVCLTPEDNHVMDPTNVQSFVQTPNPPQNVGSGSVTDLSGERGTVFVTAYSADTGSSGLECNAIEPIDFELVGNWVIADTSSNSAFGGGFLGLNRSAGLPDPDVIAGLKALTLNPESLDDSKIITATVACNQDSGNGPQKGIECGPVERTDDPVCCDISFTDNLEITNSLPNACFECSGFFSAASHTAENDEWPLIPANTIENSGGFFSFDNCNLEAGEIFIGWHGQALGPFGFGDFFRPALEIEALQTGATVQ